MDAQSVGDESTRATGTGGGCSRSFDHTLVGGIRSTGKDAPKTAGAVQKAPEASSADDKTKQEQATDADSPTVSSHEQS